MTKANVTMAWLKSWPSGEVSWPVSGLSVWLRFVPRWVSMMSPIASTAQKGRASTNPMSAPSIASRIRMNAASWASLFCAAPSARPGMSSIAKLPATPTRSMAGNASRLSSGRIENTPRIRGIA